MAIDKGKYIGKFIDEGIENIKVVESLLFEIKDGVSVDDDLATLLRALHTLKGSSRMLEFKRIEALTHALEGVFVAVREQRIGLTDNALRLALSALDTLKSGLAQVQKTEDDAIDILAFEKELAALASNEEFLVPVSADASHGGAAKGQGGETAPENSPGAPEETTGETVGKKRKKKGGNLVVSNRALEELGERSVEKAEAGETESQLAKREKRQDAKSESIRISLTKIDDIIKSIASLQSLEIASKTISMETEAVHELIKVLSRTIKVDKTLNPAIKAQFRKIEQLNGKINSRLRNYSIDVGNHTRNAYDSVISLRMLPLSTILEAYPRYVFEMSAELGKKVQLIIEGSENEIDKNIIEILSDVFLHMIRNSLDHGIESPKDRIAAGKDETGQLAIRCARESGNMKITISDDGSGINLEAIRAKAVEQGFVTADAARSMGEDDLTGFIFQSGFTTSRSINSISGRGVGMDAVRASIEQLKGSILVESLPGKGTVFTILVPLSIASLMGFPIVCGDMKFIIPANFVDTILLINQEDIITVVDRPGIKFENRIIKLYYLNQILHLKNEGDQNTKKAIFVVIIHAYDDVIALVIDSISSMRSVILKSMPGFMESIPVFSGMVLSEDYEMVPALHIPTVIRMAKHLKTIDMKKRHIEYERMRKSVLVVDDSLPTREIEGEILRAEGYKVDTAADGAEALAAAKNSQYDLICTDLNMPIMDGFLLTENVRKNEALAKIPIIVISSRESEEDQKRAAMLGANRYIIKNSFNNHNLLTAVKDLIGEANG
ncbi:response regulator receiver domain protein [Treponema primitia ZAS-2]|uniref:histidine kinase n=1 Tax=Treponema primitia (strain ATCC BAA-887 / DSM 12427 / ZAS-2) TaxID=545694 RepID=F5YNN9_TREPZ|nr:response regulator [Treponema primitia]AEF86803.1 response regulator receiver domain protein [Treponema primitia ZAS-2]